MKIVIASNNEHKSKELEDILAPEGFEIVLQPELNVPSVAETSQTFVENAILKARNACKYSGIPAIADDSGILVEALEDQPGIYSSRYAGEKATDRGNIEKLLLELSDVPSAKRNARFQCVMVFLKNENDPSPVISQGVWHGKITFKPEGENGFGYDPIFFLEEQNCTAANLSQEVKNKISHRAQALQKLILLLGGDK